MAVCIIVHVSQGTSKETLMTTLNSIGTQNREDISKDIVHIFLWCITGDTNTVNIDSLKSLIQNHDLKINLIHAKLGFFDDLNTSLSYIEKLNITSILHCTAGVVFESSFLSFLLQKRDEYKEKKDDEKFCHSILTSHGIRFFPHYKSESPLQNGIHYKLYDENVSDRAVHVFTPHLCLIDKDLFCKLVASKTWKDLIKREDNTNIGHFWYSYAMSTEFNMCIWKIDTSTVIDTQHSTDMIKPPCLCLDRTMKEESFKIFYDFIYDQGWPLGISQPLYTNTLYHTSSSNTVGISNTTIKNTISDINKVSTLNELRDTTIMKSYGDTSTESDTLNTNTCSHDTISTSSEILVTNTTITTCTSTEIQDTISTTTDTTTTNTTIVNKGKVSTSSDILETTTCTSTEIQDTISTTTDTTTDTTSIVNKGKVSTSSEVWERGFGGVNMSSEPASELDFGSISTFYGVKVIRIGAVAGAQDLDYLLNPRAKTTQKDYEHLLQVLPRLRKGIIKISNYGLKVVVTATDLPGASFQSGSSGEFWQSEGVRVRCAKFWGYLAKHLVDLSDNIMGYDLINEPHSPDDSEYLGEVSLKYSPQLHHFYNEALKEIRTFDSKVTIILNPLGYSNPLQMKTLNPTLLPADPNIAYSFHMYALPHLTLRVFRDKISPPSVYPGPVRKWINCPHDFVNVNYDFIRRVLNNVREWQLEYGISSNRILIGEFGISREIPGACVYLRNLVEIFQEYGWNWLLFSFRDEEWDSMDYELGTDFNNMLHRTPNELFMTVANHFH